MRQNQILKLQIIQIKNNNLNIVIMKKINFAALQIATNIKKDEHIIKDVREELANAMYQNARGIGYMALAMKIYKSDGEIELDDNEFKLLKDFGQGFPLFYQDALGLLEEEKK